MPDSTSAAADALRLRAAADQDRPVARMRMIVESVDGASDVAFGHRQCVHRVHRRDPGLTSNLFDMILTKHSVAFLCSLCTSRGRANRQVEIKPEQLGTLTAVREQA